MKIELKNQINITHTAWQMLKQYLIKVNCSVWFNNFMYVQLLMYLVVYSLFCIFINILIVMIIEKKIFSVFKIYTIIDICII